MSIKKIILILTVTVIVTIPVLAYISNSLEDKENLIVKERKFTQEYKVGSYKYRQQLWLDSSEDEYSNKPKFWL